MEAFKYIGSIVVATLTGAYLQNNVLYETQKCINPNLDDHLINLQGLSNSIKFARKRDKEVNNKLIADLQKKITDLEIKVKQCQKEIELKKKQKKLDMQKIKLLETRIQQLQGCYIFIQQAKWMRDCSQSQVNQHGSYTWSRYTKGSYTGDSNINKDYRKDFQKFQKYLKSLDGHQQITFTVSNLLLGDSCRGHNKKLKIKYSCRKDNRSAILKQKLCQVKENSSIFLSCLD